MDFEFYNSTDLNNNAKVCQSILWKESVELSLKYGTVQKRERTKKKKRGFKFS